MYIVIHTVYVLEEDRPTYRQTVTKVM